MVYYFLSAGEGRYTPARHSTAAGISTEIRLISVGIERFGAPDGMCFDAPTASGGVS